ncbi:hypothetical protein SAMN05216268_10629 [Streptomyces yunnanensis]|uniref:Uncharacterized protein n=1 Tax=Streptomyces yunnanensis TaxID=156453 RepID=A0A9X8QS98_9ACTN|nr:hypothetical protein SAMN05216268_10629 [Streptomyces yunnanensis]
MSHYVSIVCDTVDDFGERCWTEDSGPGEPKSATAARERLRSGGWHRTRDGRDICPGCWTDGRR